MNRFLFTLLIFTLWSCEEELDLSSGRCSTDVDCPGSQSCVDNLCTTGCLGPTDCEEGEQPVDKAGDAKARLLAEGAAERAFPPA